MTKIKVSCSNDYNIILGKGIINRLPFFFQELPLGKKILVVTDDIVFEKYFRIVHEQLNNDYVVFNYVLENGEKSKNINNLFEILSFLAENKFSRNDSVVALGGGVVSDISGLSASLYMRGINIIHIPTTLLSMVDASIGGKTAINIQAGKNLIGTFYQPRLVVCDVDIIRDLPEEIFGEGMAEVIKYGIIDNKFAIDLLYKNIIKEYLEDIIENCIRTKVQIITSDEFEIKGSRKILNAGHTFGHSLEKASNYRISHGIAVGTGLVYEAAISNHLKLCTNSTFDVIERIVNEYGLLIDFDFSFEELIEYMLLDKKNDGSTISFILPIELGKCVEYKLSKDELSFVLNEIGVIR